MEEKKKQAEEWLTRHYHGKLSNGETAWYISQEDIDKLWEILEI